MWRVNAASTKKQPPSHSMFGTSTKRYGRAKFCQSGEAITRAGSMPGQCVPISTPTITPKNTSISVR